MAGVGDWKLRNKILGLSTVQLSNVSKMKEKSDWDRSKRLCYTAFEKTLIRDLVKKYVFLVENKESNKGSVEAKHAAWEKITSEFNNHDNVTKRDTKSLKKCWDNMKTLCKKEFASANIKDPSEESSLVHEIIQTHLDSLENGNGENNLLEEIRGQCDQEENGDGGTLEENSVDADLTENEPYTSITPKVKRRKMTPLECQLMDLERQHHELKMQIIQHKDDRDVQEHLQRMKTMRAEEYYWQMKTKALNLPDFRYCANDD